MDLSGMNKSQLESLFARVTEELNIRNKQDRNAAIGRIYQIAHDIGMPIESLLSNHSPAKKPRKERAPGQRYVDPTNPNNVWLGAGPRPLWLKAALNAGVSIERLKAA